MPASGMAKAEATAQVNAFGAKLPVRRISALEARRFRAARGNGEKCDMETENNAEGRIRMAGLDSRLPLTDVAAFATLKQNGKTNPFTGTRTSYRNEGQKCVISITHLRMFLSLKSDDFCHTLPVSPNLAVYAMGMRLSRPIFRTGLWQAEKPDQRHETTD